MADKNPLDELNLTRFHDTISGLSGNKEVKKRQQRVLMILDSMNLSYTVIDIAEPGQEKVKEFMHVNSKSSGATTSDQNPRHPLPPQIFNEDIYCGDYNEFDLANENDTVEEFLKISKTTPANISEAANDESSDREDKNEEDTDTSNNLDNSMNSNMIQDISKTASDEPETNNENQSLQPDETQNLRTVHDKWINNLSHFVAQIAA